MAVPFQGFAAIHLAKTKLTDWSVNKIDGGQYVKQKMPASGITALPAGRLDIAIPLAIVEE